MLTIFTITYNEEVIMPYFIKWYRERFPNCRIIINDNESYDRTIQIAFQNNCGVRTYQTGNKLSDSAYLKIKNNNWKQADTDWVMVVDCDEFIDITENDLIELEKSKKTIVSGVGYNMVNVEQLTDITQIRHGVRATQYDKSVLFNKKHIKEINYEAGCHSCNPKGVVNYSKGQFNLYHMNGISADFLVERYKRNAERMSEENKNNKWGYHYLQDEKSIRMNYFHSTQLAKIIR